MLHRRRTQWGPIDLSTAPSPSPSQAATPDPDVDNERVRAASSNDHLSGPHTEHRKSLARESQLKMIKAPVMTIT